MSIKPKLFECTDCGAEGTDKDDFPHTSACAFVAQERFAARRELLADFLRLELPGASMEVPNWPGTMAIAHNILLRLQANKIFKEN